MKLIFIGGLLIDGNGNAIENSMIIVEDKKN